MDLVYGSEISFPDGFAIKPFRTFVVNTNAPLHSNGFEVPPSAGVATFPASTNYADRIFLWRAIGQKLYIEERSLMFTIAEGSLCIDFTRTSIIPGTSITIFEEGVLCIVVPTASAIHRFYARLHSKGRDTFSILARIKEDDEFRRFATSHPISAPGRPLRASATHHPTKNTISYCTAEGQLVIVTLGSYTESSDKHEEYTIGEVGLLGKLLGGRDTRVSDACVMPDARRSSRELRRTPSSDIVFAVTRDGWVQAWNVDTRKQLPSSVDLNKFYAVEGRPTTDNEEFVDEQDPEAPEAPESIYSIKAYPVDVDILLIVGCDVVLGGKSVGTRVHVLKMAEDQMQHLQTFETDVQVDERLVDIELVQTYFPPKELMYRLEGENIGEFDQEAAAQFSLTALFKSSSAKKSYSMKRVSFAVDWQRAQTQIHFDWHAAKQFTSPACSESADGDEKPCSVSPESSVETLIDTVFDTDLYPFDIVFRAVQVVSDSFRGSCGSIRHNAWAELSKLVDTYLTSLEFNRKFQQKTDRGIRLRLNAPQETQSSAVKDFWWALLRACEELDFSARGVISLAPMQLTGDLKIMAVVHRDRMTILGDNNVDFMEIISSESIPRAVDWQQSYMRVPNRQFVEVIEQAAVFADRRVYLMNRERARITSAKNGVPLMDDDGVDNAYDFDIDGRFIDVKPALEGPIISLAAAFVQSSTFDNSRPFGDPCVQVFAGSFTQSIVSANIRVTVESRVHFALVLKSLLNAISEKRLRAGPSAFGDVEALCCELREIIRVYRELNEQLDLKMYKNGAKMSVGTWLTSDNEGLLMMKREGGYGPQGYDALQASDFNWFVGITTDAAVRALLTTSEVLALPRRLVIQKQYKTLLTILNSYISETRALKPAITFYRGIAYSGTDHPVKALNAFQSCLDAFNEKNVALRKAVYFLLPKRFTAPPGKDPIDEMGASEYFLTVVRFLQEHGHSEEVCSVAMKAIENLPIENDSVQVISNTLFNHLTTRREWFQALKLILRTTLRAETRRASICELLTLMLSVGDWEAIATMKFGVHEQVVEDFLRDAACRQPVTDKKHHFDLLFAFFMARKDFRKAACTMYEFARLIESAPEMSAELLRRRRDCLSAVLNLQSVLGMEPEEGKTIYDDHTDTNLVFPKEDDEDDDSKDSSSSSALRPRQRRVVIGDSTSGSSPESSSNGTVSSDGSVDLVKLKAQQMAFAMGDLDENDENRPMVTERAPLSKRKKLLVLTEKDIRDEWVLCSARVGLISSDQFKGVPPTDPAELFLLLVEHFHFDEAFDVARQFFLNAYKLYHTLTREAIMIDALRDEMNIEMAATQQAGWVRLNRRHCNAVATAEDHWSVVRGLVDAARAEWPGDSRPLRGASEAFLSFGLNVPYWLHNVYENHDPNDYLRCLVDFESYSIALQVLSELVDRETTRSSQPNVNTWLPYGVIDELMLRSADFARKSANKSAEQQIVAAEVAQLRKATDQKLVMYFRKLESLEKAQQMSSRFF